MSTGRLVGPQTGSSCAALDHAPSRVPRKHALGLALAVATAATVPYLNALGNDFLTWDDNIVILGQPFLRELSLENIWKIVSPVPAREEWLPVRDLTLLVNFAVFGDGPFWFILGNILLHAAASVAVFFLLQRLVPNRLAAFLGALVFACHAVHVESVTWLSGRKDPLSALFLAAALIAHIRYREGNGRYATTLPWLVLALLSKASAFVFPLWAGAYDFFYRRDLAWRERVLPLVPYAGLALAGILTFLELIAADGVIEEYPQGGLLAVLLTNVVLFRDYTIHALLPMRHQAIYEVSFVQDPWNAAFLSSLALLACVATLAWRFRRRPWVPFAAVFFYANFIPYLNIVPHGIYYAERYLYLPSMAFSLLVGALGTRLLAGARIPRPAKLAAAGALCAFLAAHISAASARNRAWADSETFWKYQAEELPRNPAPLMNLGETREILGDDRAAARTYGAVCERFGEVPEALHRLGRIARRQGHLETAEALYERAAELSPRDPRPLNNLAEVHLASGEPMKAIEVFERLTREHPRYLLARANLARALESAGREGEAADHWRFIVEHAELLPQEGLVKEARERLAGAR